MTPIAPASTVHGRAAVLTTDDRCDRCGMQAYMRVELSSGGELLFCGHHAREYGPRLRELATVLYDETARLTR